MALHIGTSGWAYREWKPAFYPADVSQDGFLAHYASVLSACEINATHYRLQDDAVVARWAATVPESFVFTAKAHRRLIATGPDGLGAAGRAFLDTFARSLAPLGTRLTGVRFKYPAEHVRDDGWLATMLQALAGTVRPALEFTHPSWLDPEVFAAVADHGGTVCVTDTEGWVADRLPPGPFAYVRLRAERYTTEQRAGWLDVLTREAASRPVLVFARHEGIPAGDPLAGVGLAQWLMEHVAG